LNSCIWARSKKELSAQAVVFTNVNVVDTRDGRILPDMTVVVKSGRIQAVARFGLIAGSHNVRMINAAGKYMIPGLWDMDVHTPSPSAPWDEADHQSTVCSQWCDRRARHGRESGSA